MLGLFKSRLGKYVIFLLLAYPAIVGAQIGYRYIRGTGTAGSQVCWSDTFTVDDCSASESLDGSGTVNVIAKFSDADTLTDSTLLNAGVPTVGNGGDIVNETATVLAMNNSDTLQGFEIALTNANHTGSGNVFNILDIATITGDANSALNAINISALSSTVGAAGEVESAIKIQGGWDVDLNGVTTLELGADGVVVLTVNNPAAAGASTDLLDVTNTLAAMDGSDTNQVLDVAITNANHTGTGNTVNLIDLAAITGDANSNLNAINIGALTGTAGAASEVEAAIKIGAGWDVDLLLTGSGIIDGDITLGTNDVDDVVVKGPVTYNVHREDFTFQSFQLTEDDYTPAVVTDGAENLLLLYGSQIPVIGFRLEQAVALTPTVPFSVAGQLNMSDMLDSVDTDGLDFILGGTINSGGGNVQAHAVLFDEDNSSSTYCEVGLTITTIANIDEFYFGWHLESEGYIDANNVALINTAAYFRVPDNAGDLDIETKLNAGATGNDDTGITWADGNNKVLRVTLLADSVTFTLDGAAVTQTNAVLNLDDGDRMVCFWGFQNSAAAANAGMNLDYVEVGISQ